MRWPFVMSILIMATNTVAAPTLIWAADEERAEELAGEHESVKPTQSGPVVEEPTRRPAGVDNQKPTLKMPEVIIQGERQYRVTAEKRDLLVLDPMGGTKAMPADMAQVSVPGLSEDKNAPAAETTTAKNGLLVAEVGAGSYRQVEGRLIAGYEMDPAALSLRIEYLSGEDPQVFHFVPYEQLASGEFNLDVAVLDQVRLNVGLSGKVRSHNQPQGLTLAWGDWLDQRTGEIRLGGDIKFTESTSLKFASGFGSFLGQGAPGKNRPIISDTNWAVRANVEQIIPGWTPEGINLLAEITIRSHQALREQTPIRLDQNENLSSLLVSLRFTPLARVYADLGVRVDDFKGQKNKNAGSVVAQLSWLLPIGTTLYGSLDGGLQWLPVSEWAMANPYPAVGWLPAIETIRSSYRVGWRQRFGDAVSLDAAWFRLEAQDTPVWLDSDRDSLFAFINLPQTRVNGLEATLDVQYNPQWSQTVTYLYRQLDAGPGLAYPYQAAHELKTELRWEYKRISASGSYRYLGSRSADVAESIPRLQPAHLVGFKGEIDLGQGLNAFVRLDNVLNVAWQEWAGYPERGITTLGGVRWTF